MCQVKCRLFWGADSGLESDPDWGMRSYIKDFVLPFFPRKDDEVHVSGCAPVTVDGSEFDIDGGFANVWLERRRLGSHESFDTFHVWMTEDGWEFLDCDGTATKPKK